MANQYTFQLESFHIDSPMAGGPFGWGNDTDYVYFTVKVGNQIFGPHHECVGDIGKDNTKNLNWTFGPVMVGDGVPVLLSYQIVNHGSGDAGQRVADDIKIAEGITSAIGTVVGLAFPPTAGVTSIVVGALGALGDIARWIFGHGPNCDGLVLNGAAVANGSLLASWTRQNSLYRQSSHYHGPDTPDGCGSNAEYDVTWSVTSHVVPAVALDKQPGPVNVVIINKNSGLCLDVPFSQQGDNIAIQQYPITSNPNQQWRITRLGDVVGSAAVYTVASVNTIGPGLDTKCLDIPDSSKANHAVLQQFHCHGGPNQQWKFVPAGDGYYYIINVNSGLYLDVPNASIDAQVQVQQYQYNGGGDNQKWQLVMPGLR
jgi:hypothetical protein